MANRLLGKEILSLVNFTEDESNRNLDKVHITEDFAEASDSKILLRVPLQQDSEKEFPGVEDLDLNEEDILIPARSLKKIFTSAPKKTVLPILSKVLVGKKNGKVVLATDDLEKQSRIEVASSEGKFPNTEKILEFPEEGLKVCISAELLGKVVDFVKKSNKKRFDSFQGIKFTFYGSNKAIKIQVPLEEGEGIGALMPIRLEEEVKERKNIEEEIQKPGEKTKEGDVEKFGQEIKSDEEKKEEVSC